MLNLNSLRYFGWSLPPSICYIDHRITESQNVLGWKEPQRSPCYSPCCGQGYQPLNQAVDQAAQGLIQSGLEHLQGWGIPLFHGVIFCQAKNSLDFALNLCYIYLKIYLDYT